MRIIALAYSVLLAFGFVLTASSASSAQVSVSVAFGPPPLPVYERPVFPATVISELRATGHGTKMTPIITGCQAPGSWPPKLATCGRHHGGVGATARFFFMKDTGGRTWASRRNRVWLWLFRRRLQGRTLGP